VLRRETHSSRAGLTITVASLIIVVGLFLATAMVLTSLGRAPAVLVLSSGFRMHGRSIDRLAVVIDAEAIASAPVFSSTHRAGCGS
jgi:hypothetical protein